MVVVRRRRKVVVIVAFCSAFFVGSLHAVKIFHAVLSESICGEGDGAGWVMDGQLSHRPILTASLE